MVDGIRCQLRMLIVYCRQYCPQKHRLQSVSTELRLGDGECFAVERSMACLPADRLQFTLYLERLARETSSVSAVEEVFNAVNWVHSIAGLEPPSSDGVVRSVMEGVRRMYARPVVKKEPITIKDLRAIVESSNLSDLSDKINRNVFVKFCWILKI